jgi:hypothetical protein
MYREVTKEECVLHPLIHTLLEFTLTHNIDSCQGKGFGVTLIPYHLGSLGGKRESEVGTQYTTE